MIDIVVASHNAITLQNNLLKGYVYAPSVQVLRGFENVPKAYNSAKLSNDIVMYVHEDVYLPETFKGDLFNALDNVPEDWSVLGVAGVKLVNGKREIKGYINDRGRLWGSPVNNPIEVDTLDELLLITRGDLTFDEQFTLDFYGADICLQAREQGRKCYVINAFCEHNSSRPFGGRTPSFYESEKKFKEKWINHLPIATTCSILT